MFAIVVKVMEFTVLVLIIVVVYHFDCGHGQVWSLFVITNSMHFVPYV